MAAALWAAGILVTIAIVVFTLAMGYVAWALWQEWRWHV